MPSDAELRDWIEATHTIAVLGAKAGATDDAWEVPHYLRSVGFRIFAVNPKLERWNGEPAYPSLAALPEPVDLIDVFRASEHVPGHVDEILALAWKPRVVWLQLGIRHDAAAARLEAVGVRVVQDRCLLVDHRRLTAPSSEATPT
jgi:predicted CoA-binding protein